MVVQKRLLTYSDLTLVRAIEVAQSMEVAERDTQEMKSTKLARSSRCAALCRQSHGTAVACKERSRIVLLWFQGDNLPPLQKERSFG